MLTSCPFVTILGRKVLPSIPSRILRFMHIMFKQQISTMPDVCAIKKYHRLNISNMAEEYKHDT